MYNAKKVKANKGGSVDKKHTRYRVGAYTVVLVAAYEHRLKKDGGNKRAKKDKIVYLSLDILHRPFIPALVSNFSITVLRHSIQSVSCSISSYVTARGLQRNEVEATKTRQIESNLTLEPLAGQIF